MTVLEQRAVAAGDEAWMDGICAFLRARRCYTAGRQRERALSARALVELAIEAGNALVAHEETA